LFKTKKGDHLLIVIHHLVVDGVSWRILLEDFEIGYRRARDGGKIKFQEKTDSFKYWARQLTEYANSRELLTELQYWSRIEKIKVEMLPRDCREPIAIEKKKSKYLRTIDMELDEEATGKLLYRVNAAYTTEINDILLTALGLAIKDWGKINRMFINLEGHGREEIIEHMNVNRTVGWFTSQYPVLLDISKPGDLSYYIKAVKETLRRIPNKGIGFGILRYLTPGEKRNGLMFAVEPEISFNYLGQLGQETGSEFITFSRFSPGAAINPEWEHKFALNITGLLLEKRLKITFSYNKYEYDKRSIEKLSAGYRLKLLEIIDHCSKKPGRELTPSDVGYSHISLESFANIVDRIKNNPGGNRELQLMYPLSPMQAGMLYHSLKDARGTAYLTQTLFSLQGTVDRSIIERSFNKLAARYDILRTCFIYEGLDEPLQVVLKERNIRVDYEDIVHLSVKQKADYLEKLKLKDREEPYDLTRDILTRLRLLKTGTNSYKLLWSHHHILMDGWCLGILFKEFLREYRAMSGKEPLDTLNLSPVTPYMTYIKWLGKQDKQEGLDYWRHYLEGYETRAGMPKPGKPAVNNDYKLEKYTRMIDDELSGELNTLASKRNVTVNTLFQTIWGILLQKYNRTHDVVFGTVVSGRPPGVDNIENMLGLFINTVPVRIKVEEHTRQFSRLLSRVGKSLLQSMSYEYLPLAEVQAVTWLKGDLIDHLMAFENYPLDDAVVYQSSENSPGFVVTEPEVREQTNYDFNIAVMPTPMHFTVEFIYNSLAYEHQTIERISHHLGKIIKQVTRDPGIEISAIEIITHQEKKQVLFDFNNTAADYPAHKTIQQLFAEQVERTPDHTALVRHRMHLTYRVLNKKSGQLAKGLQKKGVCIDSIVGIMLERSIEMIVGMLGILKAGGAYLPIDPNNPEERIQYMLTDSNVIFLVKNSNNIGILGIKKDIDTIFIEDYINKNRPKGTSSHLHLSPVTSLAYIIYTSGSTGRPKGVLIRHSGFVNLIIRHREIFGENSRSRISQAANPAFDAMTTEVWPGLSSGSSVVIADNATLLDPTKMKEWLIKESITISYQPTTLAERLLEENWSEQGTALKVLRTAGDRLTKYPAQPYPFRFFNLYGPTEDTVWTTWTEVHPTVNWERYPEIGKPVKNHRVYILGPDWELQPIGISGELCISGIGLAPGYLNKPELTAEKFCLRRVRGADSLLRGRFLKKLPPPAKTSY
jgi:amino acid adenylation domain-containing protein/non-ribosomal peptide synthase protein (TIGR01720 family)